MGTIAERGVLQRPARLRPMGPAAYFRTTRWSLVLSTRGESAEAQRALGELCTEYWYPLFVYARQSGLSEDDASETVQSFVAQLLEGGQLDGADSAEGRFRAYLVGALRHFSLGQYRASRSARRDGGTIQSLGSSALSLSAKEAARRYDGSCSSELSPAEAFDRAWAQQVIAAATARLRDEYTARGKGAVFAALEDTLDGGPSAQSHAERAEAIGCTVGAIKVSAHRLRARLGELIRAEVVQTLQDPDALGEELGVLIQALRGNCSGSL